MHHNLPRQQSITPYTYFAQPYAEEGEFAFSEKMLKLIFSLLGEKSKRITNVLDLACGGGIVVQLLAEMGMKVHGVDVSACMLEEAKKRVNLEKCTADFYCQDMREFHIPDKVDLALSTYDSLNFMLNEEDLKNVFIKVYSSLKSGGVFVFDIYTPYGLKKCWGSQAEIHTNSNSHFVVTCTESRKDNIGIKEFFGFTFKEGKWERWYEKHVIKAYTLEIIKNILLEASFKNEIFFYDIDKFLVNPVNKKTKRTLVFAYK